MSGNSILNSAKYSSNNTDEWYTTYETIAEEIAHYTEQFKRKTVLCNCDNPFESNFCYYFLKNFNKLQLKKLICTSYSGSKIDQIKNNSQITLDLCFDDDEAITVGKGYALTVSKVPGKPGEEVEDSVIQKILSKKGAVKRLRGNGDFRTEECIKYLKQCDICCTNPPFSLFIDLFSLLVKYDKQYLLIGNQNAITYKEIFPYIKENKAWVGYRFGDMAFRVPADTEPRNTRFWVDETGQKWRSLGNVMWLTNIDIERRYHKLELTKSYDPELYPKYDNFDGINVKNVADIPYDYDGIMGVPITYIKYHNGSQFEIVGEANHGSDNEFDLFKPKVNGKELFKRILIRRKDKESKKPYNHKASNDDAITGIIEYINERGGRNLFKDDSEYDCIIDYIEALPPVQPVGRWIPVSDRLPEKGGDYLVTTEWKGSYSGDVYTETNMAVYREKEKEWDCAGVIAWMPSPEPYKTNMRGKKE